MWMYWSQIQCEKKNFNFVWCNLFFHLHLHTYWLPLFHQHFIFRIYFLFVVFSACFQSFALFMLHFFKIESTFYLNLYLHICLASSGSKIPRKICQPESKFVLKIVCIVRRKSYISRKKKEKLWIKSKKKISKKMLFISAREKNAHRSSIMF